MKRKFVLTSIFDATGSVATPLEQAFYEEFDAFAEKYNFASPFLEVPVNKLEAVAGTYELCIAQYKGFILEGFIEPIEEPALA